MGLFNKKAKETPTNSVNIAELEKQLELARKEEEEKHKKELEKKQFNETEELEDFITDDEIDDTGLGNEINKFLESNGTEQTINYLQSIITQLNVQLVMEKLDIDSDKQDEQTTEPKEVEFTE